MELWSPYFFNPFPPNIFYVLGDLNKETDQNQTHRETRGRLTERDLCFVCQEDCCCVDRGLFLGYIIINYYEVNLANK